MMIYTVYIYYSKHGTSVVEHFEMTDNCNGGKGMTAQKQGLLSVPSKKGWYIESNSWFYYKL